MTFSTQYETPRLVGIGDLEHQLEVLGPAGDDVRAGLFGPRSSVWRVYRESALFLGAGRALLLQLAHPWVAVSIAEHSQCLLNPIGRFHRTFRTVFTMVFGTLEQARAAARHLHRRHAAIVGSLPTDAGAFAAGTRYAANDVEALRWVHSTLVETAILAHDLLLAPLTTAELERYYAETRLFGALFVIPPELLPPDWPAFTTYNKAMWRCDVLTVGPAARAIADELLTGREKRLRVPRWYLAVTAHMLPMRLRDAYGLSYGEVEHRTAARAIAWLRRLYPLMPKRLRHVGPYQEAMRRVSRQVGPDPLTRLLNRSWLGQESLTGERPPSHGRASL